MSLQDLNLNISYGPTDDRLNSFFIPAMAASVRYERAAGYFSSSMLAVAAAGVYKLILNGGTMRLLCGADLAEDDVEAIRRGHAALEERVAKRMKMRLALPESEYVRNRLEVLAWLVGTGQLEIKVVLPKGPDGHPLPGNNAESYYHPKEGIFTDTQGNQIGFSGSINESGTAIEDNYETFCVYFSWNESKPYLAQVRRRFERLWEHKEDNWIAMPIPEAVKQELLKFRPAMPPTRDPAEPEEEPPIAPPTVDADQYERILFRFAKDAPRLLHAGRLGMTTCTVTPWPHQTKVAEILVRQFPERFMLCDEVGLGKTVECGLALRQLVLSGRVRRLLILVPKSVLKQWQEELYEKFVLNIPRYDGQSFRDVFDRELRTGEANPWDAFDMLLSSSHLAKRRERQAEIAGARKWDLVVIDEAHHARRKDFLNRDQYRPNRLLELLNGTGQVVGLKDKTDGLWLATATPMQIDPVEVWDLLKVVGMGGRWGASEDNFMRYFEELRKARDSFQNADWPFVLGMLDDYLGTGGSVDDNFGRVAESRVGFVEWDQVKSLPTSGNQAGVLRQLSPTGQMVLIEMARRHTPIRRFIHRNTRSLLREYRSRGMLKENVPERDPRSEFIPMKPDEDNLYRRIEEYIREFYQKYEAERRGLGFIMTVYRRRLTSSFYAMRCSLERRLRFLTGGQAQGAVLFDDDDLEQEELEADIAESLLPAVEDEAMKRLLLGEIRYVEEFLADLQKLGTDSKLEQLFRDLGEILKRRESVIIFTQYADTMDYLRERLRQVYGSQVACYSGRGGEYWDGEKWAGTSKEKIKNAFRQATDLKFLICTESASEGLNLQTCGVLINWDMPWNPMRVEQRIGRIDRIGQQYARVWVRNYFYDRTVEADIYGRLDDRIGSFEHVVGELQPILVRVGQAIERAAMATEADREAIIEREVAAINNAVRGEEVASLNLDRFVDDRVETAADQPAPITLPELETLLVTSLALGSRFSPHPEIVGAHLLDWHGDFQAVTFNPVVFDEHPNTVTLLSFGSPLLAEILEAIDEPIVVERDGVVARLHSDTGVGAVGYFDAGGEQSKQVRTLRDLRATLDSGQAAVQLNDVGSMRADFVGAMQERQSRAANIDQTRQRSAISAVEEECRQLLLEAAYIELGKATQPDLFDDLPPVEFSVVAIENLKRHGYPFRGAISAVSLAGLTVRDEDPLYLRLLNRRRDALDRRFVGITEKLKDALNRLVSSRRAASRSGGSEGEVVSVAATLYGKCVR
ncbi:MAG: DEAD/DEAH box helicase family protein [Planctomycetes bacterium]|nr:DEAD/DEAH box helicase family protein [Planctomycetota bacterium]